MRCWQGLHLHTVKWQCAVHRISMRSASGWKKRKHRRSCTEFSEFNSMSIESSDSEQHNEGSQGSGNRRGKRKASILAHQSDLYSFHLSLTQRWWCSSLQSWSRPISQSQLYFDVCFPHKCLLTTHHVVLERTSIKLFMNAPINMFLIAGTACGAECGAAAAFKDLHFRSLCWSSLHFVMWCWLLLLRSASHRWHTSLVCYEDFFSLSHYFHVFLLKSLCNFLRIKPIFHGLLLCWPMFCWLGCCFRSSFLSLPQQIWGLRWCHLPIFSLVFQSLCWSCILNWILGSVQQLLSTISRSVMWQFSSPVSISFFCQSCSSI